MEGSFRASVFMLGRVAFFSRFVGCPVAFGSFHFSCFGGGFFFLLVHDF
jgi:hypothetical protein